MQEIRKKQKVRTSGSIFTVRITDGKLCINIAFPYAFIIIEIQEITRALGSVRMLKSLHTYYFIWDLKKTDFVQSKRDRKFMRKT